MKDTVLRTYITLLELYIGECVTINRIAVEFNLLVVEYKNCIVLYFAVSGNKMIGNVSLYECIEHIVTVSFCYAIQQ